MREKTDVLQGTLALMVLKTLDVLGPQHGYGNCKRRLNIEQRVAIIGRFFAVKARDLK